MRCPHCNIDPEQVKEDVAANIVDIITQFRQEEYGIEFMNDLTCPTCGASDCYCPSKFN